MDFPRFPLFCVITHDDSSESEQLFSIKMRRIYFLSHVRNEMVKPYVS